METNSPPVNPHKGKREVRRYCETSVKIIKNVCARRNYSAILERILGQRDR